MTVASCVAEKPHAKKASVDDVFEQRWRKAYEVRALERESRSGAGKSQDVSGSGGADSQASAGSHIAAADVNAAAGKEPLPVAPIGVQPSPSHLPSDGSVNSAAPGAVQAVPAGHKQQEQPLRQQEISDDDEDEEALGSTAPVRTAAMQHAGPAAAQQQPQQQQQGLQKEEEKEEEELAWSVVWDSSSSRPGGGTQPLAAGAAAAAGGERAAKLKEQGTACLEAGDFRGAIQCYSEAIAACKQHLVQQKRTKQQQPAAGGADVLLPACAADHLLATLHSNRSHALLKLKYNERAAADAQEAHTLHPTWAKPLYRLAQARLAQGRWAAAVTACRQGEALTPKDSEGRSDFSPLLDRIAVQAAKAGSLAGYDGIQLEVRDAGEEAWLCKAAPHVPELDGPEDDDTVGVVKHLPLALPGTVDGTAACTTGGKDKISGTAGSSSTQGPRGALALAGAGGGGVAAAVDPLVVWDFQGQRRRRRTSFRSAKEAVEAAQEGDRILLRRGTHNGMGECITVSKRLLIEGEGELGEVVYDQRANCPSFRIAGGGVVLRRVSIDQSGFRESLLVEGPAGTLIRPLIQDCRMKCSGDDAACTGGAAAPTFVRCMFEGKKVGLKAYGTSAPRFERCSIEKCGEQGVRAMEASAPVLLGCQVIDCEEEAVVGMDTARLTINNSLLQNCKGPGVDLSGSAAASINGSKIEQCVGGVWLWDAASAVIRGATLGGGPSHAILADSGAALQVRETTVRGSVHASDAAWQGILHSSNRIMDPEQPTDFPPEEGPFRFVPNPYKRKQ